MFYSYSMRFFYYLHRICWILQTSRWRLVLSQVYFISYYLKVETGALSGLFYILLSQGGDWCTLRSILYLFISRWRLVHSQVYFISFISRWRLVHSQVYFISYYLKAETGALSGLFYILLSQGGDCALSGLFYILL